MVIDVKYENSPIYFIFVDIQ